MENFIKLFNSSLLMQWLEWKPIQAFLLITLSFMVAKAFDWVVTIVLTRITKKTKTTIDDKLISLLHRPIFYSILFFGLNFSITILDFPEKILYTLSGIF